MCNVVPYVCNSFIISQRESLLKTCHCHVILLGIETAQPKIVEELCIVNSHLQQSPGKNKFRMYSYNVKTGIQSLSGSLVI